MVRHKGRRRCEGGSEVASCPVGPARQGPGRRKVSHPRRVAVAAPPRLSQCVSAICFVPQEFLVVDMQFSFSTQGSHPKVCQAESRNASANVRHDTHSRRCWTFMCPLCSFLPRRGGPPQVDPVPSASESHLGDKSATNRPSAKAFQGPSAHMPPRVKEEEEAIWGCTIFLSSV